VDHRKWDAPLISSHDKASHRQVAPPHDRHARPVFFDGFALDLVPVSENVTLRVRHGGSGPAVVLLHGHPRTRKTWHQVAPLLVKAGHTVVCPDLRGYGQSSTPEPDAEHLTYCDRAMAKDIVQLMTTLGRDRFGLAGHDRGSYVAYRTALDHPGRVDRLAVLDSVPILEARSGPTPGSPNCGGTGSSSPLSMLNASSLPIRWRGTGQTETGWAPRTMRTWSRRSGHPGASNPYAVPSLTLGTRWLRRRPSSWRQRSRRSSPVQLHPIEALDTVSPAEYTRQ
jgi:pimeloyl-ACP methyl ester carboxylesterase